MFVSSQVIGNERMQFFQYNKFLHKLAMSIIRLMTTFMATTQGVTNTASVLYISLVIECCANRYLDRWMKWVLSYLYYSSHHIPRHCLNIPYLNRLTCLRHCCLEFTTNKKEHSSLSTDNLRLRFRPISFGKWQSAYISDRNFQIFGIHTIDERWAKRKITPQNSTI